MITFIIEGGVLCLSGIVLTSCRYAEVTLRIFILLRVWIM